MEKIKIYNKSKTAFATIFINFPSLKMSHPYSTKIITTLQLHFL